MKTFRTTITAVLLACAAWTAHAEPMVYTSTGLATDAVAVAGTAAQVDSKTSPPGTLPVVSTAVATSAADYASAVGFADGGLLVAQSEASSVGGFTSAVGTASFEGMFSMAGAGHVKFFIDLLEENFTGAGQFSAASLFFRLTFQGVTYANLVLTANDDPFALQVNLPGAGTGMFSLLLTSEANALAGNAANFAQAEFRAAVPEPGTLVLLLGAGLVVWVVRRRPAERVLTSA